MINLLFSMAFAVSSFVFLREIAAAQDATLFAQAGSFNFNNFLRHRPLDLSQLLGKRFSDVVPGATWEDLPVPEEYKNQTIRYGVFERGPSLHDYMKNWDFLTKNYCVSNYSMFLLFFNRGFVFRVELRYIPDSFTGSINLTDPRFCFDETPIFEMISNKLGGTVNKANGSLELTQYTANYVMKLSAAERTTDVTWDLRGGPSSPKF